MKAMDDKVISEGKFLKVNYHIKKKENELPQDDRTIDPRTQNMTSIFNSSIDVKFILFDVSL